MAKCVTAARPSAVSVDMRVRTRRSRPSGASIVPVRALGRPSTSARYSRSILRALSAACSSASTASERATTSSPLVSRSSRWTIPRAASGPPAAPCASSAWASVPAAWPRAGCTTTPAGLSTTSRCSSSHAIENFASGTSAASARRLLLDLDRLAAAQRVALGLLLAVDPHQPVVDQALRRGARAGVLGEEDVEPLARGLGGDVNPGRMARRPLQHVEQAQHAERDADVGEVEGGPGREVDEVGHVAAVEAVDEVARRAAEQQPGRQPHERAAAVGGEEDQQRRHRRDADHDQHRPAVDEQPEGDAAVAHVDELDAGEDAVAAAEVDVVPDQRLGGLVGRDDQPRPARRPAGRTSRRSRARDRG